MATKENINWKRINMGEILPCQSFLRKKNGEILKLSTVGGVKVGQDCYYLPVDEVINVIKDYPVEESEDERIRKAIYNCVKWFGFDSRFFKDVSQEECLAWLEKQSERKHQYKSRPRYVGEENLLGKKDIDDAYLKGICDAKRELEKRGEQKPILDVEIPFGAKDSELEEVSYSIPNGYHAEIEDNKVVIKKGEQKSVEWSEEDENLLKLSLENLTELKDRFGEEYGKVGDCIVWLESIEDRVQSQPRQEYDDMAYEMARAVLYDKLKDSLSPQSQWRPSDAQMKQLGWIAEQNKYNMIGKELMTLYQDLKKLRKE